jgi:hypothetical protein
MLALDFKPITNEHAFEQAAKQYTAIWDEKSKEVVNTIEDLSGLSFIPCTIQAVIYEDISKSHPLHFRSSYDQETKEATIVHELCHILIDENAPEKIRLLEGADENLAAHKQINLFLYDVWVKLFGQSVADRQVAIESNRAAFYKAAWSWVLAMDFNDRQQKLESLKINTN